MEDTNAIRIKERFNELGQLYGIRRITVDQLSRECGISKKTFYKYFQSKDELIWIVIREKFDQLRRDFRDAEKQEDNPLKRLHRFVEITLNQFGAVSTPMLEDVQKFYPQINEELERFKSERINMIKDTVREGIKTGVFENINLSIVAGFLTGAISQVLNPHFILENNLSVEEALRSFSEIFLFGIVHSDWRKENSPSGLNGV